jgi:hypothetical protein
VARAGGGSGSGSGSAGSGGRGGVTRGCGCAWAWRAFSSCRRAARPALLAWIRVCLMRGARGWWTLLEGQGGVEWRGASVAERSGLGGCDWCQACDATGSQLLGEWEGRVGSAGPHVRGGCDLFPVRRSAREYCSQSRSFGK